MTHRKHWRTLSSALAASALAFTSVVAATPATATPEAPSPATQAPTSPTGPQTPAEAPTSETLVAPEGNGTSSVTVPGHITVSIAPTTPADQPAYVGETLTWKVALTFLSENQPTNEAQWWRLESSGANVTGNTTCNYTRKNGDTRTSASCTVSAKVTETGTFAPELRFGVRQDPRDKSSRAPISEQFTVRGQAVNVLPASQRPAAPGVEAVKDLVEISLQRESADELTEFHMGDPVLYKLRYNFKKSGVTVKPVQANLQHTAPGGPVGWANCERKYNDADAGYCDLPQVTLTPDNITDGTFTPRITFDVSSSAGTKRVELIGEPLKVSPTPRDIATDVASSRTGVVTGKSVLLARPGDLGFTCSRIVALTTAPDGTMLAAWDGRLGGKTPGSHQCPDSPGPNSIVLRTSADNGVTWSAPRVIAAGHESTKGNDLLGYSDPSFVVDRETGKVFTFFVRSLDAGFGSSVAGTDANQRSAIHAAVIESSDNGKTWSEPRTITADITKGIGEKSRFAASGEGIQLKYGPHKGRLVQQFTVRKIDNQNYARSVFSDDGGKTWVPGELFGPGMDENKVVELSDGRLMVNSRSSGSNSNRKLWISADQGATYQQFDGPTLNDAVNNAGWTRAFPNAPQGDPRAKILLFTNTPVKEMHKHNPRPNGTLRVSFDDGRNFTDGKVFNDGWTGYSTITPLFAGGAFDSGTYGVLHEGPRSDWGVSYMQLSFDWLGGNLLVPGGFDREVHPGGNLVSLTLDNLGSASSSATVSATLPKGWALAPASTSAADVTATDNATFPVQFPANVAGGKRAQTTAKLVVPEGTKPGTYTIGLTSTSSKGEVTSSFVVTLPEGSVSGDETRVEGSTSIADADVDYSQVEGKVVQTQPLTPLTPAEPVPGKDITIEGARPQIDIHGTVPEIDIQGARPEITIEGARPEIDIHGTARQELVPVRIVVKVVTSQLLPIWFPQPPRIVFPIPARHAWHAAPWHHVNMWNPVSRVRVTNPLSGVGRWHQPQRHAPAFGQWHGHAPFTHNWFGQARFILP
ncbi:hypothetical protein J2S49_000931 [Arcanobacterium wilhelmae]|uniref:exo-alpha-sialidase n=1 Tax=Arcanobacterium wilhelmae TaxID=1803177 RepID=A0ABT9NAV4_9ACTO|nr:exo-alpha-sialidase [Arcanobacterium wilhelmae]MDP9800855.1 hypothetical protein [Arcanobacterium wilhelmae]WFN90224.1 exo-alpha-sialidase [Arcanobacterium wilhelmae]